MSDSDVIDEDLEAFLYGQVFYKEPEEGNLREPIESIKSREPLLDSTISRNIQGENEAIEPAQRRLENSILLIESSFEGEIAAKASTCDRVVFGTGDTQQKQDFTSPLNQSITNQHSCPPQYLEIPTTSDKLDCNSNSNGQVIPQILPPSSSQPLYNNITINQYIISNNFDSRLNNFKKKCQWSEKYEKKLQRLIAGDSSEAQFFTQIKRLRRKERRVSVQRQRRLQQSKALFLNSSSVICLTDSEEDTPIEIIACENASTAMRDRTRRSPQKTVVIIDESDDDNDVIYVEPAPVPVFEVEDEPELPPPEPAEKTPEQQHQDDHDETSNDFLAQPTGSERFNFGLHGSEFQDVEFVRPINPNEMYETESNSTSTSDLNKETRQFSNTVKTIVFNEVDFPKNDYIFEGDNLDKFGDLITPSRETRVSEKPSEEVTETTSGSAQKKRQTTRTESDSSSESDYEMSHITLPDLSPMVCAELTPNINRKRKSDVVESLVESEKSRVLKKRYSDVSANETTPKRKTKKKKRKSDSLGTKQVEELTPFEEPSAEGSKEEVVQDKGSAKKRSKQQVATSRELAEEMNTDKSSARRRSKQLIAPSEEPGTDKPADQTVAEKNNNKKRPKQQTTPLEEPVTDKQTGETTAEKTSAKKRTKQQTPPSEQLVIDMSTEETLVDKSSVKNRLRPEVAPVEDHAADKSTEEMPPDKGSAKKRPKQQSAPLEEPATHKSADETVADESSAKRRSRSETALVEEPPIDKSTEETATAKSSTKKRNKQQIALSEESVNDKSIDESATPKSSTKKRSKGKKRRSCSSRGEEIDHTEEQANVSVNDETIIISEVASVLSETNANDENEKQQEETVDMTENVNEPTTLETAVEDDDIIIVEKVIPVHTITSSDSESEDNDLIAVQGNDTDVITNVRGDSINTSDDHLLDSIRSKMSDDPAKWQILPADRFNAPSPRRVGRKCYLCKEMGHNAHYCPNKPDGVRCKLCGTPGHEQMRCPKQVCFTCCKAGSFNTIYCDRCYNERHRTCRICHLKGHADSHCTDLWRRYYLTTKEGPLVKPKHRKLLPQKKQWCSACATKGHLEFQCVSWKWLREYPLASPKIFNFYDVYKSNKKGDKKRISTEPKSTEPVDNRACQSGIVNDLPAVPATATEADVPAISTRNEGIEGDATVTQEASQMETQNNLPERPAETAQDASAPECAPLIDNSNDQYRSEPADNRFSENRSSSSNHLSWNIPQGQQQNALVPNPASSAYTRYNYGARNPPRNDRIGGPAHLSAGMPVVNPFAMCGPPPALNAYDAQPQTGGSPFFLNQLPSQVWTLLNMLQSNASEGTFQPYNGPDPSHADYRYGPTNPAANRISLDQYQPNFQDEGADQYMHCQQNYNALPVNNYDIAHPPPPSIMPLMQLQTEQPTSFYTDLGPSQEQAMPKRKQISLNRRVANRFRSASIEFLLKHISSDMKKLNELESFDYIKREGPMIYRRKLIKLDQMQKKMRPSNKKNQDILSLYREVNMYLFGVVKLNDGRRNLNILTDFVKKSCKQPLPPAKRHSLLYAYSYIFGGKHPGFNYRATLQRLCSIEQSKRRAN